MIFVGIDPGVTGAVAIINTDGDVAVQPWIDDTPIAAVKKGKKTKSEYLPAQMAEILRAVPSSRAHVFIEKVAARPDQGVSSMFGFGKGYGIWIGIVAALGLSYTLVTPQAWKKMLMQGMSDKDAARIRAQELYPGCADQLKRKKDIGRADALLIAEFGRRTLTNEG
jgi:crossover junction endodeoxyribonuclease RuvC